MRTFASAIILGLSLLRPIAVLHADDHPNHAWSASEDPYWRQYLQEHHKKYHDWTKANQRERAAYWKWRESHHDDHK